MKLHEHGERKYPVGDRGARVHPRSNRYLAGTRDALIRQIGRSTRYAPGAAEQVESPVLSPTARLAQRYSSGRLTDRNSADDELRLRRVPQCSGPPWWAPKLGSVSAIGR